MADRDKDTIYSNDGSGRTVYTRESNSTVALALLAICYLVCSANSQPSTTKPVAPAVSSSAQAPVSASAAAAPSSAPADASSSAAK